MTKDTLRLIERSDDERPLFLHEVLSDLREGSVVLDAGCGSGSFPHASYSGLSIVSLDVKVPAQDAFAATAKRDLGFGRLAGGQAPRAVVSGAAAGERPRNFVVADVETLPMAGSVADLLILNYVLEHVCDAGAAIAEAARVLRAGARLYVAVPNARSFDDRFYRFAGYFAKYGLLKLGKRLEHQQRFDFLSLNRLLYGRGFRLLSFCECPSGYTWMNDARVKKFHTHFLRFLSFLKRALSIDLFRSSNYLALYEHAGGRGVRLVTHVCSVCGLHLVREEAGKGPWMCPYCDNRNVH
ncbi:MAG: methyltransferase domain-containing protein [Candidatus Eisenbacteria bacterium]